MSDLYPITSRMLPRTEREARLRQRAKVVWLFGLSGSGKSTLAIALERRLFAAGYTTALLDGDNLRTGLNAGLGFTDADRAENIRRVAEVSRLFLQAGVICLNSFITPSESLRTTARDIIGADDLLVVYVEASFETCRARDVKGLYKKVEAGQVANFTGRDSSFEPPERPHLVLNTERVSPDESLETLYAFVLGHVRPAS